MQIGEINMEFKEDKFIMTEPFCRVFQLHKGDVFFLNDVAMKNICGNELIHILKIIPLGDMQGMVTECIWSKKKWWQFWKKKKFLGCHVEIL